MHFKEQPTVNTNHRDHTFVTLSLIVATFVTMLGFVNILKGSEALRSVQQFAATFIMLSLLYISKRVNRPKILSIGCFGLSLIHLPIKLFIHGSILSSTPIWFIVLPPLAVYFVNMRFGLYVAYVSAIEVVFLFFFMRLRDNSWNISAVEFSALEYESLFSFTFSLMVLIIFMNRSESENLKWQKLLKKKLVHDSHSSNLASLGEMAAGVAHEINNPLTIIIGHTNALKKELLQGSQSINVEKVRYRLEKISTTTQRINGLVSSMHGLSNKKNSTEKETSDIDTVFNLFHPLVNERLKYRNIDFLYNEECLSLEIFCVPQHVAQTVLNLINNSIQAIENCSNKWIRFEALKTDDFTIIKVIDSGLSIKKDIYELMFEPFFSTKETGKGLGLSLAKANIEMIGGSFYFDYQNQNTTFVIKMPHF